MCHTNPRRTWMRTVACGCSFALTLLAGSSVRAQTCMQDGDCAKGEHCDLAPVAPTCANGSACPTPAQQAGQCQPGILCKSDGDCPMGSACSKGVSGSGACSSGAGGCTSTTVVDETGECKAKPIACKTSADCPAELSCEAQVVDVTCSPASDGGLSCASEGEKQVCVYDPIACTSDKQCAVNHACTVLANDSSCSVTPCTPGDMSCAQPAQPVCTQHELKACFPKRFDCTSDASCPKGWSCLALPKNAQKDPPAGWEGATRVCLPEGLALALMGQVEVGGDLAGSSKSAGSASNASSGASGPNSSGGCSVGLARGASGSSTGLLPASVLAALLLCRRRRGSVAARIPTSRVPTSSSPS